MNRRTGWNRLYVKLARALADYGWVTLRFDGRSLGDSKGQLDMATGADLFFAIESGLHVPEASAAIDFVHRTLGERPVILAGVCGGAVTASLLAAGDRRVVGAALLETTLRHTTKHQVAQPMRGAVCSHFGSTTVSTSGRSAQLS
jgi:alpha/beta superfamily hydrolase